MLRADDTSPDHLLMYNLFISQVSPFAETETKDPENTVSSSTYLAKLIRSTNMLVAHLGVMVIVISSEF